MKKLIFKVLCLVTVGAVAGLAILAIEFEALGSACVFLALGWLVCMLATDVALDHENIGPTCGEVKFAGRMTCLSVVFSSACSTIAFATWHGEDTIYALPLFLLLFALLAFWNTQVAIQERELKKALA